MRVTISPTHFQWAQLIKEHLTQEENNSEDLDLVINHLSKSRNKAKRFKMVTFGLRDIRVSDSTFLSAFTLPSVKWSLHQENLRVFVVGNSSPVKNNRPHSQVCFKASANPSPQKDDTNHQPSGSPAACKDHPPPLQNMPFDPMAFLKEWCEKMQMMHQHQPQTIVVESRADKSRESKATFNNRMLQLLFDSW